MRMGPVCSMLSILLAVGCGSLSGGRSGAYLDVFDCLIPVPRNYAINTSDSSTTHAYYAGDGADAWGELNVWPYDGPSPTALYEILRSEQRGRLQLEEIRLRDSDEDTASLVIVTDGKQKLALGGRARRLVDPMIDACLESSR